MTHTAPSRLGLLNNTHSISGILGFLFGVVFVTFLVTFVDNQFFVTNIGKYLSEEQSYNSKHVILNRIEIDRIAVLASQAYDLPPELTLAIIEVESNFDQNAVSHVGAMGLMQLMPLTAKELRVGDPFNPKHNIFGGVKYMSDLLLRFKGDKKLAIAAYNAGPAAVKRYRGIPPYRETRNYVKKVLSAYERNLKSKNGVVTANLQRT